MIYAVTPFYAKNRTNKSNDLIRGSYVLRLTVCCMLAIYFITFNVWVISVVSLASSDSCTLIRIIIKSNRCDVRLLLRLREPPTHCESNFLQISNDWISLWTSITAKFSIACARNCQFAQLNRVTTIGDAFHFTSLRAIFHDLHTSLSYTYLVEHVSVLLRRANATIPSMRRTFFMRSDIHSVQILNIIKLSIFDSRTSIRRGKHNESGVRINAKALAPFPATKKREIYIKFCIL